MKGLSLSCAPAPAGGLQLPFWPDEPCLGQIIPAGTELCPGVAIVWGPHLPPSFQASQLCAHVYVCQEPIPKMQLCCSSADLGSPLAHSLCVALLHTGWGAWIFPARGQL